MIKIGKSLIFLFVAYINARAVLETSERLLSNLGHCGSWNDLAEIDCTATPRINVLYTIELHDIKIKTLSEKILESSVSPAAEPKNYNFRGSEQLPEKNQYQLAAATSSKSEQYRGAEN